MEELEDRPKKTNRCICNKCLHEHSNKVPTCYREDEELKKKLEEIIINAVLCRDVEDGTDIWRKLAVAQLLELFREEGEKAFREGAETMDGVARREAQLNHTDRKDKGK